MFDWVAKNNDEYIFKAIQFSSKVKKLSEIRKNLREIALKSPLCDSRSFSKNFSDMLWNMWNKFQKDNL
jgi:predicted O-linked N-acetylglucosamine transferase (SPINDLY family)